MTAPAPPGPALPSRNTPGLFYASTSDVPFHSEAELREHYKSDWHRYNLKRKVAGLPPVTRDWFEARRSKLLSTGAAAAPPPASSSASAGAPGAAASASSAAGGKASAARQIAVGGGEECAGELS